MWISNDGLEDRQIAIAMLRAFRGMTQDQLAEAADLSPGTVSLLESGQQSPRDETFEQIERGAWTSTSHWWTTSSAGSARPAPLTTGAATRKTAGASRRSRPRT